MLYIDDKKIEITEGNIFVGKFIKNGDEGYNINMSLNFINMDNNKKGYIKLDVGFEKSNDIKVFLNREYCGIPFCSGDNQYICFEVFNTEKFLDTALDSKLLIKLREIKDDKVEVYFEINDELIKIKFDGYLDIDFSKTKDIFL